MPRKHDAIVAIDFGSTSTKICAGRVKGNQFVIEQLAHVPMPEGAIREGVIMEPDTVQKALRGLLHSAGVKIRTAYIAVGGSQTTARPVRMPTVPDEVLRKTIQFEASRYLPSSPEEHLIGYGILNRTAEQTEILLVAAPRTITDPAVEVAEKCGLEVELVELQPFAGVRTVQAVHQDHLPMTYGVIDFGGGHTQISVVRNTFLLLTRHIPIAGETFTAALKGYFHYDDQQAQDIKAGLNLAELIEQGAHPQENPPLRLIQPIMDELVREIRRSLNYYQSQYQSGKNPNERIECLYLIGGSALLKGSAEYISHKLGLPVVALNPFDSERIDAGRVHPDQLETGARWATVIGSACATLETAGAWVQPKEEISEEVATATAA